MVLVLLLFLVVTSAVGAPAQQERTVRWGEWQLTFDYQTGDWLALAWKGQTVSEATLPSGTASVDIAIGEREERRRWCVENKVARSRLVDWQFDEQKGKLTLTREVAVESGQWQLQEQVQFGAFGNPHRVARSLRLTWFGEQPAKFYRVRFLLPLPKRGVFLFPTADPFEPNHSGDLSSCAPGWGAASAWGIGQLLVQQSSNRTLLFINDARRDPAFTYFWTTDSRVFVAHEFMTMGWAEPNEPQSAGTAFLEVVPDSLSGALRAAFWRWFDDLDIKVPADRPKWTREVALYSFHPGGTIGSNCLDLGGFAMAKRILLPVVRQLGFGAIWLLPLESGGIYNPQDYYRFQEGLGTAEEYRQLVAEAHRLGVRVWQDLVPHGGTPEAGMLRGNRPWWLVLDEDGNAFSYWCFDFREPEWQQYIGQVAEHYARSFGIDGFRVDAAGGSRTTTWRRRGFPPAGKVPANVPPDWWRSELTKVGGEVPPLPYERGSLTLREGGLHMLRTIRQSVRRVNPDGAVLGEVDTVPYMQEADVVYDFALCHRYLVKLRDVSPAEFVWALQRYFEEQRYAEPRWTTRLRYVESHDSLRAQGWLGVSGVRALMALTFWIDGMPMLYHEAEIGHGPFIQRLLTVRRFLPELQTGDALYTDASHSAPLVKAEPKGIFTCLRTNDYIRASVSVINFNPHAVNATVRLPLGLLHLDGKRRYAVWEAMAATRLAEGTPAEIATVRMPLAAYQAALLVLRPSGEGCPVPRSNVQSSPSKRRSKPPSLKRSGSVWVVTTAHYGLTVDARTGLLRSLSGADGRVLVSASELVSDEAASIERVLGSPVITQQEIVLPLQVILSDGTQLRLTYRCFPQGVNLQGTVEKEPRRLRRIGLLLHVPDVHRWQINTVEGLLDDWFFVRHLSGKRGTHRIYWRPQGTEIVWQSETIPLHPDDAWLCFQQRDGRSFRLAFDEPLRMGVDNVMLLDKVWEGGTASTGARVAVMWRDDTSFTPANGLSRTFSLRFSLPPFPRTRTKSVRIPQVTLAHHSTDWVVENAHYRILLRRTGGAIRALWAKQPVERLVFADSDIYTDKGFRNVQGQVQYAGSKDDVEAGVRIWQEGSTLRMRFFGVLRAENERFRMVDPPMWFVQEYAFDSSPTFAFRFAVMSEGDVQLPPAFLAWKVNVPNAQRFAFFHGGSRAGEWLCDEKQRCGETVGAGTVPDAISIADADGHILASLTSLRFRATSLPRNIFMHGKQLFIAWLDGDEHIAVHQWQEAEMKVTVAGMPGKTTASYLEPVEKVEATGIMDPSFETGGAEVFALSRGTQLRFGAPKGSSWVIPPEGCVTAETARTGRQCAKVVNMTGTYALFTQYLSLKQFPPGSKVRLSAWLKGEQIRRGDQGWKTASLDLSIQHKDGRWEHKPVALLDGTFDWRKVGGVVDIPDDAMLLMVRAGINGGTGVLWIDDVQVELVQ
jgi:hypothetical protein